jgi:hypothetical protein
MYGCELNAEIFLRFFTGNIARGSVIDAWNTCMKLLSEEDILVGGKKKAGKRRKWYPYKSDRRFSAAISVSAVGVTSTGIMKVHVSICDCFAL